MAARVPSEQEVLGYFETYKNWGRWGKDDQLGTINFITPAKRKRAAALVAEGVPVTCARPIKKELAPDINDPMLHFMTGSGECFAGGAENEPNVVQSSGDFIGLVFHGYSVTHVDSLAHVFWNGKMYNGFPAEAITVREFATKESIDLLANGVVSRGVLLDMPRLKGVKWLEPGTPIFPEELEAAEKACGVKVESGDILLVRTGWYRRRLEMGPVNPIPRPGLQAACIPWLHQRQVAMLGADGTNDVAPSNYQIRGPIHQIGIPGMGLWLLDNGNLEDLAAACEKYKRWEFLLSIGPLRIVNGTGSPVNPIAMF